MPTVTGQDCDWQGLGSLPLAKDFRNDTIDREFQISFKELLFTLPIFIWR
jgi:hypothetical protein